MKESKKLNSIKKLFVKLARKKELQSILFNFKQEMSNKNSEQK